MRLLIWASILLIGCADADKEPETPSAISIAGYLESSSLDEVSGLAGSQRHAGLLWAINDDGPADLHAMDSSGARKGKVRVAKANNRDWEDLAAFTLDDQPYLLIADIGDNERRRKDVRVYVVEEPDPGAAKVAIAWTFEFSYPDGPRDAEAIAVDAINRRILVLSKRDIPAELYELPLQPDAGDRIVARQLGAVDTLVQPSRKDVSNALAVDNWHWQPTAMDIAADGGSVLILTYRRVYYYARTGDEPWADALARRPLGLNIGRFRKAESITFGKGGDVAFVTTEKQHAPLLRIDLSGAIDR